MSSGEFLCPRREESPSAAFAFPGKDRWVKGCFAGAPDDWHSCSYCGSLDPMQFMASLQEESIILGVTDKSYKVYVHLDAKELVTVGDKKYPTSKMVGKFYFQHLSVEQRKLFVTLLNQGKLHFGYPGRFTVLPFFIRKEA